MGYPRQSRQRVLVRWAGERKLNLVGNATNLNGIDSDTFSKAVINGLKRWKTASAGSFEF